MNLSENGGGEEGKQRRLVGRKGSRVRLVCVSSGVRTCIFFLLLLSSFFSRVFVLTLEQ